jgi:hypothetical protein
VSHLAFELYCYPALAGPVNIYKKIGRELPCRPPQKLCCYLFSRHLYAASGALVVNMASLLMALTCFVTPTFLNYYGISVLVAAELIFCNGLRAVMSTTNNNYLSCMGFGL